MSEGEASRDGRRRPEATGRKISLPILAYRGSTSECRGGGGEAVSGGKRRDEEKEREKKRKRGELEEGEKRGT